MQLLYICVTLTRRLHCPSLQAQWDTPTARQQQTGFRAHLSARLQFAALA